jgi:hypothetical protein
MIVSRVLVTKTWFGLVIGFINHLQVVFTINYNIVSNFHTTNHSTQSISNCLHYPFPNNGFITQELAIQVTPNIPKKKVFQSHFKCIRL